MPCPSTSWGILSHPPSCPQQQAGGPTQRPQGAPRPHSCSIPALRSQPERAGHGQSWAGHRQSQARNQAGWRPPCREGGSHSSCPPHPQEKPHLQGWLFSGPGPTFLPALKEQNAVPRGQLGAAQASVLVSILWRTGPTPPNLHLLICGTGLGHEEKAKSCSRNTTQVVAQTMCSVHADPSAPVTPLPLSYFS